MSSSPRPPRPSWFSRIFRPAPLAPASEDQFAATALETAGALVLLLDLEGRILRFNSACEQLSGWSFNEVHGRVFWELLVPQEEIETTRALFLGLREGGFPVQHEGTWISRSRGRHRLRWSHSLRPGAGRAVSVGIDVTESRRLEDQLRQAQKMEAIGRMAGGVAHDFNNLLTVIIGYAELLQAQVDPLRPERAQVDEILTAGARAAAVTKRLLAFARKQVLEPRTLDLNAVVSGVSRMLRRMIGEDLLLSTVLARDLGAVHADPGQIEQILMNLAVNARDAMPGGGRVEIRTANVDVGEEEARKDRDLQRGPYVLLSVADSGCGMDAEPQSHLFEPFFTTKPEGQGTGLGLSTVYGIVRQSGGAIRVESEPGKGTAFRIYLPRRGAPPHPDKTASQFCPPRGSETVLAVEDSDVVRRLIREALQAHGSTVLEARHGEEALVVSWAHRGQIHLLLTDLIMPHMGGSELADLIAPSRPGMKILYSSGHPEQVQSLISRLGPSTPYLPKPFTPSALAVKVRQVLDDLPEGQSERRRSDKNSG